MPVADTAGQRLSPASIDGVCRMVLEYPHQCCHGACLKPATHRITVTAGKATVEHLRCPTHLAWSQEKQHVVDVHEVTGA